MSIERYVRLKENEKIVLIVRRYLFTYAWWGVVLFLLLVGPFFFLFPLLGWGGFGKFIITISLGLGAFCWIRLSFLWKRDCLIITTHRIIDVDQRGFTKRTISEGSYDRISDVSHEITGIMRIALDYGLLRITCGDGSVILRIDNVKNPKEVHHVISEMMSRYLKGNMDTNRSTPLEETVGRLSQEQLETLATAVIARLEDFQVKKKKTADDE